MNTRSLRFRMTAWYASLLAGALVLFSASVYIGLRQYLDLSLQRLLTEEARSIGDELLINLPEKGPAWLKSEINEHYAPGVNGRYISVRRSDGTPVYLSDPPANASFDPQSIPVHSSSTAKEYSARVEIPDKHQLVVEQLRFSTPDGNQYWVAVGAPYQQVETVLHGLLVTLTGYLPLIISLAFAGGYWLMRRSLRPIEIITRQAEGITSTNLSQRLPVIQTGDEVERLSKSLNGMITRLEKAFQHINRFSADASHELRTPLTILQLELESIAQHHQLPVHLADQIGSALEETQRLSRIVENLLTITRLDAGEGRMEKVRVDIGNVAASTAEQMHLLAEEKSISMRGSAAEEVWVEGDRSRLKQVVVNLIDNAIKYTPQGGIVTVTVSAHDHFARLEVADNGIGIAPQALPYIFERFYRADKARSRESGGSGLGLAIVKAICTAHGGDVKVVSHEGLGSSFVVELPLCESGRTQKNDYGTAPKDATPRAWTLVSGKTVRI